MLAKAFQFRHAIWCCEYGFFDAEDFPDGEERDQYDPYSSHFAVLNADNDIVAYARLIHHSPIGYPVENNMILDCDDTLFERDQLGEISRIAIHKDYRAYTNIIYELMRFITIELRERNITYTYGSMERAFIRLLRINKIKYEKIGRRQYYYGWRFPGILYTEQVINDNPKFANAKWEDYTEVSNRY